jgi:hypothetical protein
VPFDAQTAPLIADTARAQPHHEDNMTLADISSIATAISAFAILISLIFVNIQVRQAEKYQRASIQQGRASRTADIAMSLMEPDFAEVHSRCMRGDANITEAQLRQFFGYCRAVFLGAEDSFIQHEEVLLDEKAYLSFISSIKVLLVSPGIRVMWQMTRDWYGPEFAAFMDVFAREAAKQPPIDQLAQWKEAVTAEIDRCKAV